MQAAQARLAPSPPRHSTALVLLPTAGAGEPGAECGAGVCRVSQWGGVAASERGGSVPRVSLLAGCWLVVHSDHDPTYTVVLLGCRTTCQHIIVSVSTWSPY